MSAPLRKAEEGYIVLITILVIGIVATTVALFLLITGTDAGLASSGVESESQARGGALACAELALGAIQANTSLATPASGSSTLDSTTQETCSYTISGSSPNFDINSIGTVRASTDNFVHRVTVSIDQVSPKLHVTNWQDVP
jgi:hypothetical protein